MSLTFVVEAKQVDEGAVRRAQRGLVLLRGQRFEVGEVGRAAGRDHGRLGAPVRRGGRRGLVIGSHVTARPAGEETEMRNINNCCVFMSWFLVISKNYSLPSCQVAPVICLFLASRFLIIDFQMMSFTERHSENENHVRVHSKLSLHDYLHCRLFS